MRSSCRNIMILSTAAITVAAALLLWSRPRSLPCPVSIVILRMEPSGMVDDTGAEYSLADVALTNHDPGGILIDEVRAEAGVTGGWVTAPQPWQTQVFWGNGQKEEVVLIPKPFCCIRIICTRHEGFKGHRQPV